MKPEEIELAVDGRASQKRSQRRGFVMAQTPLQYEHWPTSKDIEAADQERRSYASEVRAYRLGWLDNLRVNPEIRMFGVLGAVVVRDDSSMVFVPHALMILQGCICVFELRNPNDIPL